MKALIIVDMQNDFITGPLGTPRAKIVEQKIANWLPQTNFDRVILTQDTHFEDYLSTAEGQKLPIEHCICETEGHRISSTILSAISNMAIPYGICTKFTFGSMMWRNRFGEQLDKYDSITMCGVCTDICIITNALILKTFYPETPIYIIEELCAGTTPQLHQEALDIMRVCQINIR